MLYKGLGSKPALIHNLCTRWWWVFRLVFQLRVFIPLGTSTYYPVVLEVAPWGNIPSFVMAGIVARLR